MPTLNDICNEIVLAKGSLETAHKAFNQIQAADADALDRDSRKAWQAVVSAIDSLSPVYDWALDNV